MDTDIEAQNTVDADLEQAAPGTRARLDADFIAKSLAGHPGYVVVSNVDWGLQRRYPEPKDEDNPPMVLVRRWLLSKP